MIKQHVCQILEKVFNRGILSHQTKCISFTSLFGGYGICYNGIIFARIYQQQLFLKSYPQIISIFTQCNMQQLEVSMGVSIKKLHYYSVTTKLWQDEKIFIQIMETLLELAYQEKISIKQCKEFRIKDMPNMTVSLERLLFKIGVVDIESFRKFGVYETYYKLRELNKDLSNRVLFILHSALMGIHVELLSLEQKQKLKDEYQIFYQQQIKRRKKNSQN